MYEKKYIDKVVILADMYYNYKHEQTNTENVKDTHKSECLSARINLAISILYYYKMFIMSRRKMAYCESCGKEVKTKIVTKKETFYVREDAFKINAKVMVCAECGEEIFNEKLDSETLISVYDKYRKSHNLLFPNEIKKIRKQYGLSRKDFARLLNWDDKAICRYENGAVQTQKQNDLLLFLREPENMRTYLTKKKINFSEKQIAELLDTIDKLE